MADNDSETVPFGESGPGMCADPDCPEWEFPHPPHSDLNGERRQPPLLARIDKRNLRPFTGATRRWFVRVEWKPQDCWLGVFWKRDYPASLDVWVCLLPMVPLHFGWQMQVAHSGG